MIIMDFSPPPAPDPPVCTLISQDFVSGESTFECTWNKVVSVGGCAYTVDYHPYFWTEPGNGVWDPGWIGDNNTITVITADGVELYGIVESKDSLGNVSVSSGTGGNFTSPRINFSFSPTPGGPTATATPTPTITPTPTPGAWFQAKGGDIYQPFINQPVPLGEYFLDFMPTPAVNPYSAGVIWSITGRGNYGFGEASPVEWEAAGIKSNTYSFSFYWETLKSKAKNISNSIVGSK